MHLTKVHFLTLLVKKATWINICHQEHILTTCFSSILFLFSRVFMRALASFRAASNWSHLFGRQISVISWSFQTIKPHFRAAFLSSSITTTSGAQPASPYHRIRPLPWAPSTSAEQGCGAVPGKQHTGQRAETPDGSELRSQKQLRGTTSTWANWWCCVIISDWNHITGFL